MLMIKDLNNESIIKIVVNWTLGNNSLIYMKLMGILINEIYEMKMLVYQRICIVLQFMIAS